MSEYEKIDFPFTPSKYQKDIFDFIIHGTGNAVIRACAGSGKTTTIVSAMKLVPESLKCLFIAFNKSIVEELSAKLEKHSNCTVKTVHSLGFLMVQRNIGNVTVDEYKYITYVKTHINELRSTDCDLVKRGDVDDYISNIIALIDFSRSNLAQSVSEIEKIADKYDIATICDECDVVAKCLEWGKTHTDVIDYGDMVWLPYELSMKPIGLKYDWIFLDECQDFSKAYVDLFHRCFKRGTRFVAVGDKAQSINMFCGASEDAFDGMCCYPNTKVFNLPISYRCGKRIVDVAKAIVPDIEPRDGADEGVVVEDCRIADIKDGDMVLSRSKAPLLNLYVKLLTKGVNCYIKGKDIGKNLISLLERVDCNELNQKLDKDGVFSRLYTKMFKERNIMMENRGIDVADASFSANVMNLYDSISALEVLSDGCATKKELIKKIDTVFQDDENGICLSTIHKAKGLEADNVYVICRSSMPSSLANKRWEVKQETNLIYVAITRAKHKLGYISEKEVPPFGSAIGKNNILANFSIIEKKVCAINGTEPVGIGKSVELSKLRLESATEIKNLHENDNKVLINQVVDVEEDCDEIDYDSLMSELG